MKFTCNVCSVVLNTNLGGTASRPCVNASAPAPCAGTMTTTGTSPLMAMRSPFKAPTTLPGTKSET